MQIDRVSANVRFSKELGHGAWKVIELGAEGTVDHREDWQTAQAELYTHLSQQLKALWPANGNEAQEPAPTPQPEHWCPEHQTEFKRYERQGQVWFSHKTADGNWCKEQ